MPKKSDITDLLYGSGGGGKMADLSDLDLLLMQAQQGQSPEVSQAQINAINQAAPNAALPRPPSKSFKSDTQQISPALTNPSDLAAAQKFATQQPDVQFQQDQLINLIKNSPLNQLAPAQSDLSPTLALIDSINGGKSNLTGAYKKPGDYNDQSKMIAGIQALIQQQQGSLSDSDKEYLKLALSGKKIQKIENSEKTDKIGGSSGDPFKKYHDMFTGDEQNKNLFNAVSNGQSLMQQLDNPNTVSDQAIGQQIAKMVLKNQISDYDAKTFTSPGAFQDQLLNIINKKATGFLSNVTRKQYRDFATRMLGTAASQLENRAQNHADAVGVGVYGLDKGTALNGIGRKNWEPFLDIQKKEEQKSLERQKEIQALKAASKE